MQYKENTLREYLERQIIGAALHIASSDECRSMYQFPEIIRLIQAVDEMYYFDNKLDEVNDYLFHTEKSYDKPSHTKLPDGDGRTFPSNCCAKDGGFCVSIGSDESTWHYECSLCKKPCDPATK